MEIDDGIDGKFEFRIHEIQNIRNDKYSNCVARGVGQISLAALVKILFRGKYIILNRRDYFSTSAHK